MYGGGEFQLEALKVQCESCVLTNPFLQHVQVGAFLKTSGQDIVNDRLLFHRLPIPAAGVKSEALRRCSLA